MAEQTQSGAVLFELAQLHYGRGDFEVACVKATEASDFFLKDKQLHRYLECQNVLLRIFAEREDATEISRIKETLQDLVLKEDLDLNSKTYYTLGICSVYRGQHEAGLDYFQKALAVALAADNREDLCYAVLGLSITYMNLGRLTDALREIYNLKVFFEVLDLPDVEISAELVNASILRKLERHDQALEVLLSCYDRTRDAKNVIYFLRLLYALGRTYQAMGEVDLARFHLRTAQRMTDPKNLKSLYKDIENQLQQLGFSEKDKFDLVFDLKSKSVTENRRGKIDFKNQFILMDLLHLFMRSPGIVFSKESIAEKLWGQDYDPGTHDNKIYVTIKRLRKLIEPDFEKPRYIFRAKNGYYLNKSVRILVQQ